MFMHARTPRLNILHVATINKPISSQIGYGPIETVIHNIDKGLHALGHRSIVACSSDSTVTGEKYGTVSHGLGDYSRDATPEGQALVDLHLARALARARMGDIDIIHMHEWFERVYTGSFNPSVPMVMTLHVPGQHSGVAEFRQKHPGALSRPLLSFVAISEYQRQQYTDLLPVTHTVLHGIDVDEQLFKNESNRGSYLFSIGRIAEVKGQDIAIEVAKQSGAKLVLAGCVQNKKEDRTFFQRLRKSLDLVVDVSRHPVNSDYYDRVMQPILSSDKQIIYIGELDTAAKKHWYRHAQATLFPIRWGEPFGMVLIESMAAGTPVLAFGEGAVPEVVKHGETGFVVDSVEAMVKAVACLEQIDRRSCRRHVETHFSTQRMAEGYSSLYRQLVDIPTFIPEHAGYRLAPQRSQYISATQPS
jgi:glycosyltransferase involved in cell wall biosynthesis